MDSLTTITTQGLVPILRGLSRDTTLACVQAVHRGGCRTVEVTFNTEGAPAIIEALRQHFGDTLHVGAGTVLTVDEARAAAAAGASFILSPHCEVAVIEAALTAGLVAIPGAGSATEVLTALRAGAQMVKIFPAGNLGPSFISNLHGPFRNAPFMAVGGVDLDNAAAFIRAGALAVGVGGCLFRADLIAHEDWDGLETHARRFLDVVREARRTKKA